MAVVVVVVAVAVAVVVSISNVVPSRHDRFRCWLAVSRGAACPPHESGGGVFAMHGLAAGAASAVARDSGATPCDVPWRRGIASLYVWLLPDDSIYPFL